MLRDDFSPFRFRRFSLLMLFAAAAISLIFRFSLRFFFADCFPLLLILIAFRHAAAPFRCQDIAAITPLSPPALITSRYRHRYWPRYGTLICCRLILMPLTLDFAYAADMLMLLLPLPLLRYTLWPCRCLLRHADTLIVFDS